MPLLRPLAAFLITALIGIRLPTSQSAQTSLFLAYNASDGSLTGVDNCTCSFLDLDCTVLPFCTCVSQTLAELTAATEAASTANAVSWWNTRQVLVCCENATNTELTRSTVAQLVDFSYTQDLSFRECHQLLPSDQREVYTVYGLRELSARTADNVAFPSKAFDLEDPDGDLTDDSRLYRDHHLAVVSRNIVDGERDLKAVSFIHEQNDEALPSLVQTAIERSPSSIRSKSDGTFMWTPIYSDLIV